jgi:hypothetical protein
MKTASAFFAVLLLLTTPLSRAQGCVVEEEEIVAIGELSRETFAGPPNYESVQKGDQAETHWILTVRPPVTFCPLADSKGRPHPIGSVNRFQLVVAPDQPGLRQALIARYAVVRGRIFVAHTGHHHTAALIRVTELRPG